MEEGKRFLLRIVTFNYLHGCLVENPIQTLIVRCHIVVFVWFIDRAWAACGKTDFGLNVDLSMSRTTFMYNKNYDNVYSSLNLSCFLQFSVDYI